MFAIEVEPEEDGRLIAEATDLSFVLAYWANTSGGRCACPSPGGLHVLADKREHGEPLPANCRTDRRVG